MLGFNPISPSVQLRRRPIDDIFDAASPPVLRNAKPLDHAALRTSNPFLDASPSAHSYRSHRSDGGLSAAASRVSIVKKEYYSDVVAGLTASQGSLSLVTALLAGFAFAGLSSVSVDEYNAAPQWVAYLYPVVATVTIATFLYTAICCAVLEQHGRIAKSLALARGANSQARADFEIVLEEWYKSSRCGVGFLEQGAFCHN